jgi:hypothetical protein
MTDEEIFRLFSSIQADIGIVRQEQEFVTISLSRLNISLKGLTDEMINFGHRIDILNRHLQRLIRLQTQ